MLPNIVYCITTKLLYFLSSSVFYFLFFLLLVFCYALGIKNITQRKYQCLEQYHMSLKKFQITTE